jgi:hypothetical protein
MTALPKMETPAQRWARLHRRIKAAGRCPAMTLEGCELQAAMLDSGQMKPLPPPPKALQRVMDEDERQRLGFYAERMASEDEEAESTRAEYREAAREARELEDEQRREWPFRSPDADTKEET